LAKEGDWPEKSRPQIEARGRDGASFLAVGRRGSQIYVRAVQEFRDAPIREWRLGRIDRSTRRRRQNPLIAMPAR